MRVKSEFFEKVSAAIEKMKRFGGAFILLFSAVFGAAAQNVNAPIPTPTIDPAGQTPASNQTDSVKPITIQEAIDLALKQASAFRASQIGEQIAVQDV